MQKDVNVGIILDIFSFCHSNRISSYNKSFLAIRCNSRSLKRRTNTYDMLAWRWRWRRRKNISILWSGKQWLFDCHQQHPVLKHSRAVVKEEFWHLSIFISYLCAQWCISNHTGNNSITYIFQILPCNRFFIFFVCKKVHSNYSMLYLRWWVVVNFKFKPMRKYLIGILYFSTLRCFQRHH